jgi:thiamine-phosphate pyrophosphorylase
MPLVYYITDRHCSLLPILQQIRLAIEVSVDLIQIREKDLPTRQLLDVAAEARYLAKGSQSKILINDRLDIAIAADLDGVHLGQHSLPPGMVRAQIPHRDFLVGVSVHSLDECRLLENQGVSFATLGPVFFTPSKAAYGAPIGLGVLKEVCRQSKLPVLALGGIDQKNYLQCLECGAAGIAAIRLFQGPGDVLRETVEQIKKPLPRAGRSA